MTVFSLMTVMFLSSFASVDATPWTKLGSRKVNYGADHDEIIVTMQRGTFRALKIRVENADVHIDRIVVHYRHGRPESLNVRSNIRAGGETRVLDLKGTDRVIRKVDFYYKTPLREGKKAKIILFGRH